MVFFSLCGSIFLLWRLTPLKKRHYYPSNIDFWNTLRVFFLFLKKILISFGGYGLIDQLWAEFVTKIIGFHKQTQTCSVQISQTIQEWIPIYFQGCLIQARQWSPLLWCKHTKCIISNISAANSQTLYKYSEFYWPCLSLFSRVRWMPDVQNKDVLLL